MTTLDQLRLKLVEVDSEKPEERLEGKAFSLTRNNQLGFRGSNTYHIPIPYAPGASKTGGSTPSALASSCIDALEVGLKAIQSSSANNQVFIDITHLGDSSAQEAKWMKLFNSKGDHPKSVHQTLVDLVNTLPSNYTPIIRFLIGLPGTAEADTEIQAYDKFVAGFNRAGTQVHIGYYQPSFNGALSTTDEANESKAVQEVFDRLVEGISTFAPKLGLLLSTQSGQMQHVLKQMVPAVSWNHAKILAVNGHTLVTGGANYYEEYADGVDGIVDMSARLQGDVTLTAHHYCDYFWEYLNKPHVTDTKSFKRSFICGGSSSSGPSESPAPVPLSSYTATPVPGDKSVLAVGKLGDWVGPTFAFNLPIQLLDAARDMLLNLLYQVCQKGLLFNGPEDMEGYMGTMPDKLLKHEFDGHKVWPAAWASRIARNEAISQAKKTIYMSLAAIATNEATNRDEYKKSVEKINNSFSIAGFKVIDLAWDGVLWPLDLLFSLSKFLNRAPETKLSIILSGNRAGPVLKNNFSYQDDFSVKDVRDHMKSFCKPPQGKDFETWFNEKVEIKRMWDNQKGNHSKVICIDPTEAQSLLYTGSDNPYPNYNEEFGVWIEDRGTIKTWVDQCWTPLWDISGQPERP